MKVLHILDSLNRGGVEMLTLDVCRNARQNGLNLSFVATGGGTLESDFKASGVPFFRLHRQLPLDPFVVFSLRRLIAREGFDVIHAHQAVAGLHGYLASRGMPVRRVLSFHGFYAGLKERSVTNFLIPRMSANISCSAGLLEWLSKVEHVDVAKGFRVVYNGVDTKRLEYSGAGLREELHLSPDALLIGMVAHFYAAPRKDQITLCRGFIRVAEALPQAHLILVGGVESGGESKHAECLRLIHEAGLQARVHFLGRRDDLAKVVQALDIYVFSSLHEGLPIALMEAMLARKPCILSDIPPHVEVSGGGAYAELFQTENVEALAVRLLDLGRDASRRDALAERGHGFARGQFSIESHIENLRLVYSALS